eukprot:119546-Chlamydomonas_euryale.AAC.1
MGRWMDGQVDGWAGGWVGGRYCPGWWYLRLQSGQADACSHSYKPGCHTPHCTPHCTPLLEASRCLLP